MIWTPGSIARQPVEFTPWTPECLSCNRPMKDLSTWDQNQGRILRYRCIAKDCKDSIFQAVKVPSFSPDRFIV